MKLSQKIYALVLTGAFIAVIVVAYFSYSFIRGALTDAIGHGQLQTTRQTMDEIDRLLFERKNDIESMGEDEEFEGFLAGKNSPEDRQESVVKLDELSILSGPWDILALVDLEGTIVVSIDKREVGGNIVQYPESATAHKEALEGRFYYSDLVVSNRSGKPTIIFAYPVRDEESIGEPIVGSVIGQLSWAVVQDLLETVPNSYLFNKEGVLIGSYADDLPILGQSYAVKQQIARPIRGESGYDILSDLSEKEQVLVSYTQQEGYLSYGGHSWSLVIETPTKIALAPAQDKAIRLSIVAGVITLLSYLAILYLFNRSVLRQIVALTTVVRKIKKGDFSAKAERLSNDEIGELGTAFNEMSTKLQEMYVGLEKRVHDRTQDLEESRNKLAKLTERFIFATRSAKIGVWEWNVVENTLVWDDRMYVLYGVDKKNFGGAYEAWLNGLHPEDKIKSQEEVKLALEGKKDLNTTFRVVWPNGSVHDMRAFAAVERDKEGKPLKMVGVNWDVTKEMEVDKAKSEFVSLASHQLRTPLSTINWYAEMLESGDAGPLNEKQHEFLKEIYVGSQRMVTLVNALLNVSRLELGRLTVDPSPTDITAIAKTLIAELKPLIKKNELIITEKYEENLPKVNVDPKLVSIVFQNLLTNSVKYSKKNGAIDFSIELKKAGDQVEGQKVSKDSFLIVVKDNGIGIPESQRDAVFTKLFRADNARERDQDGTGLGLYVVKEIVDLAKGNVWYVSKEGVGTTFFILLPKEGMLKSQGKTSLK